MRSASAASRRDEERTERLTRQVDKDHVVNFRVRESELAFIDSEARRLGLSRSSYLRMLISVSPRIVTEFEEALAEERPVACIALVLNLEEVKNELRKQGTNINQGIKAFNALAQFAETHPDDGVPALIDSLQGAFYDIAESYDSFEERFASFADAVDKLRGDGRVDS